MSDFSHTARRAVERLTSGASNHRVRRHPMEKTLGRRHSKQPFGGFRRGDGLRRSLYAPGCARRLWDRRISRIHGWRLQDLGSTVVGVCGRDVTKASSIADDFRPRTESESPPSALTTSPICSIRFSPTSCMYVAPTDCTLRTRSRRSIGAST